MPPVEVAQTRKAQPTQKNGRDWRLSLVLKQQPGELSQIPPPDHPGVMPGRFDIRVLDVFRLEPVAKPAVDRNEAVFRSASDPKQADLRVRLRVE